jgi:hypothetical protein
MQGVRIHGEHEAGVLGRQVCGVHAQHIALQASRAKIANIIAAAVLILATISITVPFF